MNVVGLADAYSMVPFVEFDSTTNGQVIVDFATASLLIEEDPKNGSFLPH